LEANNIPSYPTEVFLSGARRSHGLSKRGCAGCSDILLRSAAATLIIVKLDRLSRNAAFLLMLRASGVRFVAVDMPEANDLTAGVMALVAQAEREAISRRTKEALAVAKARGVKLGNPNGAESLRRAGKGGAELRAVVSANAAAFAADLAPVLADVRAAGHASLRAIAAELTARGIRTRRKGVWGVGNVRGLIKRSVH
jgi:Resolvase, N terminal domain